LGIGLTFFPTDMALLVARSLKTDREDFFSSWDLSAILEMEEDHSLVPVDFPKIFLSHSFPYDDTIHQSYPSLSHSLSTYAPLVFFSS